MAVSYAVGLPALCAAPGPRIRRQPAQRTGMLWRVHVEIFCLVDAIGRMSFGNRCTFEAISKPMWIFPSLLVSSPKANLCLARCRRYHACFRLSSASG